MSAIWWKWIWRQDDDGGKTFRTNVAFIEYPAACFLNRAMGRGVPALSMHGGSVHGRMIEVYRAFDKGGDSWSDFRPGVTMIDRTMTCPEELDEE